WYAPSELIGGSADYRVARRHRIGPLALRPSRLLTVGFGVGFGLGWGRGPQRGRQPRTGVVDVQHERPQRRVTNDTHRRRIGGDALESVQVYAVGVRDHRLDDITVSAGQPQHVAAVFLRQPPVVFAHRGHRTRLHLRQPFTA